MVTRSAALRAHLESTLGARVPSPFTFRERRAAMTVPTGVPEIDALTAGAIRGRLNGDEAAEAARSAIHQSGGLPRGALTEIVGPSSSGRTSLMLSLLAQMSAREEVCALVDASDAFDPRSAEAAGVDLKRLLWVRCGNPDEWRGDSSNPSDGRRRNMASRRGLRSLEQTLRATDLLLAGGGLGLVVVDLGDVPPRVARRVPLAYWFRFRRAVENTPTVLVVLEQAPYAKTCASLVLRLETSDVYWSAPGDGAGGNRGASRSPVSRISGGRPQASRLESRAPGLVPHARLLRSARLSVEMTRARGLDAPGDSRRVSFEVSAA